MTINSSLELPQPASSTTCSPKDFSQGSAKELYHAPQVKLHGQLERLTLTAGSSAGTGTGAAGTGNDDTGLNG